MAGVAFFFILYFQGLGNIWLIIHTQIKVTPAGRYEYVLEVETESGPPTLSISPE